MHLLPHKLALLWKEKHAADGRHAVSVDTPTMVEKSSRKNRTQTPDHIRSVKKVVKHVDGGVVIDGKFHQTKLFKSRPKSNTSTYTNNQAARRRIRDEIRKDHEIRAKNEKWKAGRREHEENVLLKQLEAEKLSREQVLKRDIDRARADLLEFATIEKGKKKVRSEKLYAAFRKRQVLLQEQRAHLARVKTYSEDQVVYADPVVQQAKNDTRAAFLARVDQTMLAASKTKSARTRIADAIRQREHAQESIAAKMTANQIANHNAALIRAALDLNTRAIEHKEEKEPESLKTLMSVKGPRVKKAIDIFADDDIVLAHHEAALDLAESGETSESSESESDFGVEIVPVTGDMLTSHQRLVFALGVTLPNGEKIWQMDIQTYCETLNAFRDFDEEFSVLYSGQLLRPLRGGLGVGRHTYIDAISSFMSAYSPYHVTWYRGKHLVCVSKTGGESYFFKSEIGGPVREDLDVAYHESFIARIVGDLVLRELYATMSEFAPFMVNMAVFAYQITMASTRGEMVAAVYQMCNVFVLRFPGIVKQLLALVEGVFNTFTVKTEALADEIDRMYEMFMTCFDCKLLTSLRAVVLSMVSINMFNQDVSVGLTRYLGPAPECSIMEFFGHIKNAVVSLVRCSEFMLKGGSFSEYLMAEYPVKRAMDDGYRTLAFANRIYSGLPVEGFMCSVEFCSRMSKSCRFLEDYVKTAPRGDLLAKKARIALQKCTEAWAAERAKSLGRARVPPVAVLIYGAPGVGKSKVLLEIARLYAELKGRGFDEQQIFNRVVTSQYWQAFEAESQDIVHYSELGNLNQFLVKKTGDPVVMELTSLIDGLPFPVDMAAVDDKGKTFAKPGLVLIDTNNPSLNLGDLVCNVAAYQRRFIYIEVKVQPRYCKPDTCQIDTAKVLREAPDPLDVWLFKVHTVVVLDKDNGKPVVHLQDASIHDLRGFLRDHIQMHMRMQEDLNERMGQVHHESDLTPVEEKKEEPRRLREEDDHEFIEEAKAAGMPEEEAKTHYWYMKRLGVSFYSIKNYLSFSYIKHLGDTCAMNFNMTLNQASPDFLGWIDFAVALLNFLNFMFLAALLHLFPYYMSWILASVCTYYGNRYWYKAKAWWYGTDSRNPPTQLAVQNQIAWYVCYFGIFNALMYFVCYNRGEAKAKREDQARRKLAVKKVVGTVAKHISEEEMKAIDEELRYLYGNDADYLETVHAVTEAKSEFPVAQGTSLDELEEKSGCVKVIERIKLNTGDLWNAREIIPISAVAKNDVENTRKRIARNTYVVRVLADGQSTTTVMLGICGRVAIMNAHALLPSSSWQVKIPANHDLESTTHFHTVRLFRTDVIPFGEDLVMFNVVGLCFKDLREYFAPEYYPATISQPAFIGNNRLRIYHNPTVVKASTRGIPDTILTTSYAYQFPGHKLGDCGQAVISEVGTGWCIVGIHAAASNADDYCYATYVTRPMIDRAYAQLALQQPIIQAASEGLVCELPLVEPELKSPWRFEQFDALRYFGKIDRDTHIRGKSDVRECILAPLCESVLEYELIDEQGPKFGAPPMKPFVKNGEWISPWNISLNGVNHGQESLDPVIAQMVIDELRDRLSVINVKMSPLTMKCAINGITGDAATRRMDVSTSAGTILGGKKERYLPIYSVSPGEVLREPTREVLEKTCDMIRRLSEGEQVHPIYGASLKDEVRSRSKIETGATRVFYSSSLEFLIIQRMYLLPFFALLSDYRDVFGCFIGANMHMEADAIYRALVDFSTHIMIYDFKWYDLTIPEWIKWITYTVVCEFLQTHGYNDFSMRVVQSLLTDMVHPVISMNNDLYMASNRPSGMLGTTENNSLDHLACLMYAFHAMKPSLELKFFDHVKPGTNGDDGLTAVKPAVISWFNATTFAAFCKNVFHMTVTGADKSADIRPFVGPEEMEVLKRTFVESPILRRIVAPLSKDSLAKMVAFYIPSEAVSHEKQMCDTAVSFLTEWFFWCKTREDYMKAYYAVTDLLLMHFDLSCADVDAVLPSFESLVARLQ